jgi:hypothetical protein
MVEAPVFTESEHPRDRFGRFRQKAKFDPPSNPRSFTDLEGEEWADESFKDWRDGLTPEQKQAVRGYSNQDYTDVNNFLRNKGTAEGASEKAKLLTDTMRSSEMPEDVTVHRLLDDPAMVDALFRVELDGAEFRDEGFTSTTMDPDMLAQLDLQRGEFPILAQINIPKGARGAAISGLTGFPEEQELLLAPGSTFRVRKSDLLPDNTITVVMDLVEQDV